MSNNKPKHQPMSNQPNNQPNNQQPTNQTPKQEATKVEETKATTEATQQEAKADTQQATQVQTTETTTKVTEEPKKEPEQNQRRTVGVSAGTLTAVHQAPESSELPDNLASLEHNLKRFEERLSRRTSIPVDEVAKQMNGLYSLLVNTINANKSIRDFTTEWSFICSFFKQHQNEGLSVARLYRGVTMWPRSQDDYLHFQSLINLIYVTNNEDRKNLEKQVNLNKVTKGLTEGGRGRILSFYL